MNGEKIAVVPGYYLVCYNNGEKAMYTSHAVVPGYYLVCYNTDEEKAAHPTL